jgi:hypothetical protein
MYGVGVANAFAALAVDDHEEEELKPVVNNKKKENKKKSTPTATTATTTINTERKKPDGKREKDRESGTGRNDTEKRKGAGNYNWGVGGEEVPATSEAVHEEEHEAVPEEEPVEEVKEPETFTLDEYLSSRTVVDEDVEIRKVKLDTSSFVDVKNKKNVALQKEHAEILALQKEKKDKKDKKQKAKENISSEFFSGVEASAPREYVERRPFRGGERGGARGGSRGAPRGRGGARGARGGRRTAPGISIANQADFPSL